MRHRMWVAGFVALAACGNSEKGSCIPTVPSTLLHEIACGREAPQGICFSEFDNGF